MQPETKRLHLCENNMDLLLLVYLINIPP
jgi:hypothetical protein